MDIKEVCSCGASFSVASAIDPNVAIAKYDGWLKRHSTVCPQLGK